MRKNLLEALSDNIVIDMDKCTFCGICVDTCILDNLRLELAPCRQACPMGVNCQGYVQLILRGMEEEALEMVERDLPFPSILGRLCSAPCEKSCHRNKETGEAVAIRDLKRYLTDLPADEKQHLPEIAPADGKRTAVVGSGPAGLTAAFDLLRQGHQVVLLDSEDAPGGMLRWAIPEFRLPLEVLEKEFVKLEVMGVDFQGGVALGRDISLDDLAAQYDAVIVATGCPKPKKLGLEGEEADGVLHALTLLRQVRTGRTPIVGRRVVVIGGGDVALDAAQAAVRLGAEEVRVVSLESREIMPADPETLEMAEAEGIILDGAWGPTQILTDKSRIVGVEFQRCLAVLDRFGRFAPTFDQCTMKTREADTIIIAIGQEPDLSPFGGVEPKCRPITLQTERENIFLAGDGLNGPTTIVEAMASGREAAESVHRLLTSQHLGYGRSYPGPFETEFAIDTSRGSKADRVRPSWKKLGVKGDFTEIIRSLSPSQAREEAGRCYSCGRPFGKFRTCWFCLPCEVECPNDALWVEIPYLLR